VNAGIRSAKKDSPGSPEHDGRRLFEGQLRSSGELADAINNAKLEEKRRTAVSATPCRRQYSRTTVGTLQRVFVSIDRDQLAAVRTGNRSHSTVVSVRQHYVSRFWFDRSPSTADVGVASMSRVTQRWRGSTAGGRQRAVTDTPRFRRSRQYGQSRGLVCVGTNGRGLRGTHLVSSELVCQLAE
jgi:hypothetical protein